MPLYGPILHRHGAYLLACREFQLRYEALCLASTSDLWHGSYASKFDDALQSFYRRDHPRDLPDAASQVHTCLTYKADEFERSNPEAAEVLRQTAEGVIAKAPTWDAGAELEAIHRQGAESARRFFEASPWPVTKERLADTCELKHEDKDLKKEKGYCPLRYMDGRPKSITACFTAEHGFNDYSALPFLFLHEYTAHVFSTDNNESPLFNEGWMVHAAEAHLLREKARFPYEQSQYSAATLVPPLAHRHLEAIRFAGHIDTLSSGSDVFRQITYELAAFTPDTEQTADWPEVFMNVLRTAHRYLDSKFIRDALASHTNTREMAEALTGHPQILEAIELISPQAFRRKSLVRHGLLSK